MWRLPVRFIRESKNNGEAKMSTIGARFQNPRNHGTALEGFCLLLEFSPLAVRTLSQGNQLFGVSGEPVGGALPVTSICGVLVRWLPADGRVLAWCYRMDLVGAAVRLLCRAL
jgi:hypothetical protein